MFYSNLLKCIASVAAALMFTSCLHNVKSTETNFKYVAIPEQTVEFKAKEISSKDQGKAAYLISDIVVKAHDDVDLRYLGLEVILVDKMGVELISLSCDRGVLEKGVLKLVEFSSELSLTKDKKELEALVSRASSLRFIIED
jgi:hypothetical protein